MDADLPEKYYLFTDVGIWTTMMEELPIVQLVYLQFLQKMNKKLFYFKTNDRSRCAF